jgi:hypothetical protein
VRGPCNGPRTIGHKICSDKIQHDGADHFEDVKPRKHRAIDAQAPPATAPARRIAEGRLLEASAAVDRRPRRANEKLSFGADVDAGSERDGNSKRREDQRRARTRVPDPSAYQDPNAPFASARIARGMSNPVAARSPPVPKTNAAMSPAATNRDIRGLSLMGNAVRERRSAGEERSSRADGVVGDGLESDAQSQHSKNV